MDWRENKKIQTKKNGGKDVDFCRTVFIKKTATRKKLKIISYCFIHEIYVQKYKTGLFAETCENILFAAL